MNTPAVPKKLGAYTGKVVRRGAGGFGFIHCSALKRDAYFKESFVVGRGDPEVGDDVDFLAMEYPGDKLVAFDIRLIGEGTIEPEQPESQPGAPLTARIRGLESIATAPMPTGANDKGEPGRPRPIQGSRIREPPNALPAVVRFAEEEERGRIAALRARAADLEAKAETVALAIQATRAEAARRKKDLERRIAELEVETTQRLEQLDLSREQDRRDAERLSVESDSLEGRLGEAVTRAAVEHLTTARNRFCEELLRRERAVSAIVGAREHAAQAAGEERVSKYEEIRRKARGAEDPDVREAFALLEQQKREPVRAYAEAMDALEAWPPLETPFWLLGSAEDSTAVVLVTPYDSSAADSDGPLWRVHSAVAQAAERMREMVAEAHAGASIERAEVVGCFALRIAGLDADLLPLLLEDACNERPSLTRLGVKLRCEEQRDTRLPVRIGVDSVESVEATASLRLGIAVGGTSREMAQRLGMRLDELVRILVAKGLPFEDDALSAETEEGLRSLLGIASDSEPRSKKAKVDVVAAQLAPALDVAARVVGKLLRSRVIGGKHTAIDNVYGHHFADSEKELARSTMEKLIRLGVLCEKPSTGARHVSLEPRRLEIARSLAERRCTDPQVVETLTEV